MHALTSGRPAAASRSQKPRTIVSRSSPASEDLVSQSATLSMRISEISDRVLSMTLRTYGRTRV